MHEHFSANEKRIFMDSRILSFNYTGQVENCVPQFLVKPFFGFHSPFLSTSCSFVHLMKNC